METKKNLFTKAKDNGEVKSTTKKTVIREEFKLTDKKIIDKFKRIKLLRSETKTMKSELTLIEADVNQVLREHFISEYLKTKTRPEAFRVIGGDAGALATPADAYISVNEDLAESLKKKFGNGIITEKTVYGFNAELLEKYQEVLSDLINDSKKIHKDDKEKLITAVTAYSITPGTIDKLLTYKDPKAVYEAIRPTLQMKFTAE
jgi:hypothetical protein